MMDSGIKIAISGKGGVGKTTLAALLCKAFREKGYSVLAVDADPASGLPAALGFSESETPAPITALKDLIAERTGVQPGSIGPLFTLNPRVDDLPEKLCAEHDGIRLLIMGTVQRGGAGCLCPEGALLRALVQHLILYRREAVIMDMEAGLEHLGRATAQAVHRLLVVVEPGMRSIETARTILRLAADIHLRPPGLIANKLRSEDDRRFIEEALQGRTIVGQLLFDDELLTADMRRLPPWVASPASLATARGIADRLIMEAEQPDAIETASPGSACVR